MDAQQQIVALLESELQKSILGGKDTKVGDLLGTTGETPTTGKIGEIFNGSVSTDNDDMYGGGNYRDMVLTAMRSGAVTSQEDAIIDQDSLRHLLYQARALLGELRIEEQAWNGEVNSEKTLRKEVNDFAKV